MQQRMILSRIRIRVFFYPRWYPYRFRSTECNCRNRIVFRVIPIQNIYFGFSFSAFGFNKDKDGQFRSEE